MNTPIYRFTVWSDAKGRDFATCGDLEATSMNSATANLARQIVALDCVPDGPIHCHNQAGRLSYTISSLHWWAKKTVSADTRIVDWKPSPFAKGAAA